MLFIVFGALVGWLFWRMSRFEKYSDERFDAGATAGLVTLVGSVVVLLLIVTAGSMTGGEQEVRYEPLDVLDSGMYAEVVGDEYLISTGGVREVAEATVVPVAPGETATVRTYRQNCSPVWLTIRRICDYPVTDLNIPNGTVEVG